MPELLGDVVGDPRVGGGGGREHRDAVGQVGEQRADPAVVGPEVVAPVGDAVGLVDDEQAAGRGQPGQHLVAEAGVVEPLGADQEHVDLAGPDRVVDRLPRLDVGGVDRHRADARPARPRRSGCASARAAGSRSPSARRPRRAAAAWPRSRPRTCPSRCAARPGPAGGRRRAPRSPATGPRAARRRRGRPARAGAARPRGVRRSRRERSCLSVYQRAPTPRRRRPQPLASRHEEALLTAGPGACARPASSWVPPAARSPGPRSPASRSRTSR